MRNRHIVLLQSQIMLDSRPMHSKSAQKCLYKMFFSKRNFTCFCSGISFRNNWKIIKFDNVVSSINTNLLINSFQVTGRSSLQADKSVWKCMLLANNINVYHRDYIVRLHVFMRTSLQKNIFILFSQLDSRSDGILSSTIYEPRTYVLKH